MGLFATYQKLPLGVHYAVGRFLALLLRAIRYRTAVVSDNLRACFPEKSKKELRAIRRKFYRNLGIVYAEALWLGGCRGNKQKFFDRKLFRTEGTEELYKAFEKGSVMIMDSHCGNWEITGAFLQGIVDAPGSNITEKDVAVVYRYLHNEKWDKRMARIRCALQSDDFQGYIESRHIMRYAIEHKNEKKIYVFPNDQYPYGLTRGTAEIEFFGRKTLSMEGGLRLAVKFGMSVFYMNKRREADGTYTVRLCKICDDASVAGPLEDLLKDYYRRVETDIRETPASYLWSHRRWK